MKDKMLYKNFIGSVHYSSEDEVFHGKIEGINDLVTFEGSTVKQLKIAFKDAVEDYIELCTQVGKDALKSFKGSFNIRIGSELHSKAFRKALLEGKTLNQWVQEAIEKSVKENG